MSNRTRMQALALQVFVWSEMPRVSSASCVCVCVCVCVPILFPSCGWGSHFLECSIRPGTRTSDTGYSIEVAAAPFTSDTGYSIEVAAAPFTSVRSDSVRPLRFPTCEAFLQLALPQCQPPLMFLHDYLQHNIVCSFCDLRTNCDMRLLELQDPTWFALPFQAKPFWNNYSFSFGSCFACRSIKLALDQGCFVELSSDRSA